MQNPLQTLLDDLKLKWIAENLNAELAAAARKKTAPEKLLERLFAGELAAKRERAAVTRLRRARIPTLKTLDRFDFGWPSEINADLVRHLFTLRFLEEKNNIVFIGTVGTGKTHLASALAYKVCQKGENVIFTSAIGMIQNLEAAIRKGTLKAEMRKYANAHLLVIDELGYLPINRQGSNLMFQVINERYEKASTIITTNRAYQDWAQFFDDDPTATSALLDRILHHCETVIIEGESYRMKDRQK